MKTSFLRAALLGALLAASGALLPRAASAQVVERPIPFDSAGRVTALSPALARRLNLAPPAFPVTGTWTEARLFAADGRTVLVVRREDGAQERRELSASELETLRAAVHAGLVGGVTRAEDPDQASRPAKGAFIRDQLILSSLAYAPALAELTDDAQAGAAVYLLATGGAFFTAAAVARDINVTRAQQFQARDAAWRGFFAARAMAEVFGVDPTDDDGEHDLIALTGLVGGIGGSVVGFNFAKHLTDGEARSAALTSTTLALTVLGASGSVGMLDNPSDGERRAVIAGTVAAGVVGYPLGRQLARRAGFTLTGGDVRVARLGGILGAATGLTLGSATWKDSDGGDAQRLNSALATAGWLGGVFVGTGMGARRFDYTESEAFLLELGAGAGALMGAAVPVLVETDEPLVATMFPTLGAVLGTVAAHSLVGPRRAMGRSSSLELPVRVGASPRRARATFSPEGVALAAAGMRGKHSILSVTF